MIGSELKNIRISSGLSQAKFSKLLGVNQVTISKFETGALGIPSQLEKIINKMVNTEYKTILTNKVFSRELFLKNMLTGNEVIDDIYINAEWLKSYDNKQVYAKGLRLIVRSHRNKNIAVGNWKFGYVIIGMGQTFYCKEEWIKWIVLYTI